MKRMISALLCMSVLTALLCVPAPAETAEPEILGCGDYEYILLPDGTAEIRYYSGKEEELIIPDSVVFIDRNALKTDFLLTVTVPRNSCAAQYCKDNKLDYTYADAQDWLSR